MRRKLTLKILPNLFQEPLADKLSFEHRVFSLDHAEEIDNALAGMFYT
jgi:hypothetical protein